MHHGLAHDAGAHARGHLAAMAQPTHQAQHAQRADGAAPAPAHPRRDHDAQVQRQQRCAEDVAAHQPGRHERHPLHEARADLGGLGVLAQVDLHQAAERRPLGRRQRSRRRGRRVGRRLGHGVSGQAVRKKRGILAGIGPAAPNLTRADRAYSLSPQPSARPYGFKVSTCCAAPASSGTLRPATQSAWPAP